MDELTKMVTIYKKMNHQHQVQMKSPSLGRIVENKENQCLLLLKAKIFHMSYVRSIPRKDARQQEMLIKKEYSPQ